MDYARICHFGSKSKSVAARGTRGIRHRPPNRFPAIRRVILRDEYPATGEEDVRQALVKCTPRGTAPIRASIHPISAEAVTIGS
jgi:hypothetical protein